MCTIECNQKCSKCSHWKQKDKSPRFPVEKVINLLKDLTAVQEFCIVGGEPLLFKQEIIEILRGTSETNIRTVVITNGVALSRKFVEEIAGYNIHIVVSIDTIGREFWKYVRGANSFEKVMHNLETAISILSPDQISIQSVLAEETESHIPKVAEYAKSKNIFHSTQDYVQEGFNGNWTSAKERISGFSEDGQQCYAAGRNLSIMQNGDVYTCFQQPWISGCEQPVGNLNSTDVPLMLNSEYIVAVENKMRECNLPCKVLKCNLA